MGANKHRRIEEPGLEEIKRSSNAGEARSFEKRSLHSSDDESKRKLPLSFSSTAFAPISGLISEIYQPTTPRRVKQAYPSPLSLSEMAQDRILPFPSCFHHHACAAVDSISKAPKSSNQRLSSCTISSPLTGRCVGKLGAGPRGGYRFLFLRRARRLVCLVTSSGVQKWMRYVGSIRLDVRPAQHHVVGRFFST